MIVYLVLLITILCQSKPGGEIINLLAIKALKNSFNDHNSVNEVISYSIGIQYDELL